MSGDCWKASGVVSACIVRPDMAASSRPPSARQSPRQQQSSRQQDSHYLLRPTWLHRPPRHGCVGGCLERRILFRKTNTRFSRKMHIRLFRKTHIRKTHSRSFIRNGSDLMQNGSDPIGTPSLRAPASSAPTWLQGARSVRREVCTTIARPQHAPLQRHDRDSTAVSTSVRLPTRRAQPYTFQVCLTPHPTPVKAGLLT